jgi:hypothetical protein
MFMQMQEPEQQHRWQAEETYSAYRPEYSGGYEANQQQTYEAGLAANDYQGQKVYPQPRQSQRGKILAILGIIFSSIVFFVSVAGIVLSSLVLRYADGRHLWQLGGGIGLAGSILVMLVCIGIFVVSVVWLALRATRRARARRRNRYQTS